MTVRFDDALPVLVEIVAKSLGGAAVEAGVAVRDTSGRLAFYLNIELKRKDVEKLSRDVREAIGPYARSDRLIAGVDEFGVEEILREPGLQTIGIRHLRIKLADRRLVGGDWLRSPASTAAPPPRFVFSSLKGGVGRSTALCVVAADLAARGRRVLAIDLDMEAPGLGAMLFDEETRPEFGLVDALVESAIGQLDRSFLSDVVGASPLAQGRGRIDLVPALGKRSLKNPGSILAKLSRAYVDVVQEDGSVLTLMDRVRQVVDTIAARQRYDAVLVDARAGLHETTPSAVLGLGAEVFLFGLNEPQTFQGYSALFAHIAQLESESTVGLADRLTMVQGKADGNSRRNFEERCQLLYDFLINRYREGNSNEVPLPAEPFKDVPWDDSVSDEELSILDRPSMRAAIAVLDDERFKHFEPIGHRELLSRSVYGSAYQELLDQVWAAMAEAEGN